MSKDYTSLAESLFGTKRLEDAESSMRAVSTISGSATSGSSGGSVDVILSEDVIGPEDEDGNQEGTVSIEVPSTVDVEEGDDVIVSLIGDENSKTPVVTGVIGGGDRMKVLVLASAEAAELAETAAAEAYDAVEAVCQNFFADANGIHVATTDGDADTGPNLLANSLGILLRDGTILRTAQTASGFAVYDGNGNEAGNIVALLGETSTIGKAGNAQLVLAPETLELLDAAGDAVLIAGTATVEDAGGQRVVRIFKFGDAIASGNLAAAFGYGSALGDYSFVAGTNSGTLGYASQAFGEGSFAINEAQLVCGKWNKLDTTGLYLFIVGNGTDEDNLSNAFAVGENGTAYADAFERFDGGKQPGEYVLYNGSTNGNITLSDSIENYDRVRIYFANQLGYKASTEAIVSGTGNTLVVLSMAFAMSSTRTDLFSRPIIINGTSLTNDTARVPHAMTLTASGNSNNNTGVSYLNINRVVGIKD